MHNGVEQGQVELHPEAGKYGYWVDEGTYGARPKLERHNQSINDEREAGTPTLGGED